ncbi:hypothetical protein BJV74DRAFT_786586, partial [Russula compacta]
ESTKHYTMKRFVEGSTTILCATEAAGMGMDIQNIDHVVQFMAPLSLSILVQ